MFQKIQEEIRTWKGMSLVMYVEQKDAMTKVNVSWQLISPPSKDDTITVSSEVFRILEVTLPRRAIAVQPWWR